MYTWVYYACTPQCILVGPTSIEDRPFGYLADPRCAVSSGVLMTILLTLDLRSPSSLVRNRSEVAFSIQEQEIGHRMLVISCNPALSESFTWTHVGYQTFTLGLRKHRCSYDERLYHTSDYLEILLIYMSVRQCTSPS